MSEKDKDMSGAIFKNDRKSTDKHPDLTGHATINGEEFWVSAWKKQGKNGPFYSLSFSPKSEAAASGDDMI